MAIKREITPFDAILVIGVIIIILYILGYLK